MEKSEQKTAAESMEVLFEQLPESDTLVLESLLKDIHEKATGFIHGVGVAFATKFYKRLTEELTSRGFAIDPAFWPRALKEAKDYEADTEDFQPRGFADPFEGQPLPPHMMNRKERRKLAAEQRRAAKHRKKCG